MKPMKVSAVNAAGYYYQRDPLFSRDDLSGSNAVWVGRGSTALGLHGQVNLEAFNNLLYGHDPSGSSRLVGRDNGDQAHHHHAATDIPLSAPKSFSVAGMFDLSVREAFERAVTKTAEFIDNHLVFGRQTHDGITERVPGKMVAALFMHSVSRANDIHLHAHLVAMNMVLRPDGSFSTMENRPLFQHQAAITQNFYSHLADETRAIGYGIEQHLGAVGQKIPELAGYRQEINDLFSKRHESIISADQMRVDLEKRLPHLPEEARGALIQLQTKDGKDLSLNEVDLVKRHTEQLEAIGINPTEYLNELKQAGHEIQAHESLTTNDRIQASPHLTVVMEQEMTVQNEAAVSVQDHTSGEVHKLTTGSATLEAIYAERLEELKSEADGMNNGQGTELTQGISLENNHANELQHQQDIELAI